MTYDVVIIARGREILQAPAREHRPPAPARLMINAVEGHTAEAARTTRVAWRYSCTNHRISMPVARAGGADVRSWQVRACFVYRREQARPFVIDFCRPASRHYDRCAAGQAPGCPECKCRKYAPRYRSISAADRYWIHLMTFAPADNRPPVICRYQ